MERDKEIKKKRTLLLSNSKLSRYNLVKEDEGVLYTR